MKVTEIKAQTRRARRFSVFVDGKYAFSLSEAGLLEQKLYVGQELEVSEVGQLKQAASDEKMYGLALRYVALRPRSNWEVSDYLKRKAATSALSDQIVNKLSSMDLLNDLKFARAWVESRRLLRPTSRRKLQQELRAKHVSNAVISQVLRADENDEREALRQLVAKKRARYPDRLKFMRYLVRQGFNYDAIKSILDEESV